MKAQHNYTTTVTTATWLGWGTATLLILAMLIVGLMVSLRINGRSTLPTSASEPFVRHVSDALASCRSCRDEWVAAQAIQPARVAPTQQQRATGAPAISRAAGLIEACRVCRDEWVAAKAPSIPTSGVTFDQPEGYVRASGPR